MNRQILVIAGPTAVGKTEYALKLAEKLDGEIVSCDAYQLYQGMDIGTAKPTPEELARIPHHMIDVLSPKESCTARKYQTMAKAAIEDILTRGKLPIISGGTGLYLNSLLFDMDFGPTKTNDMFRKAMEHYVEEYGNEALYNRLKNQDPAAAERIHPNNVKRVIRALEAIETGGKCLEDINTDPATTEDYEAIIIGLRRDRSELYDRINRRVDILIDEGLVNEVRALMSDGLSMEHTSMQGIGYKEIVAYLEGETTLEAAIDTIKKNTRHYAKRQMTWFKRYEDLHWFDLTSYQGDKEEALKDMLEWVNTKSK